MPHPQRDRGYSGYSQNTQPAVVGVLVVQAPCDLLHTHNLVVPSIQFAPVDPVEQVFGVVLKGILCGLQSACGFATAASAGRPSAQLRRCR